MTDLPVSPGNHRHAFVTFGNMVAVASRAPSGDVDVFVGRPSTHIVELQTSVFDMELTHDEVVGSLLAKERGTPLDDVFVFEDQLEMPAEVRSFSRRSLTFDAGCWVVIAPYARGKTVLVKGLAASQTGEYYRFGEPEGGGVYYAQLLYRLAFFLVSCDDCLIVDSVRNLTYMSGGSTGEGGVNNEIFVFMGALSAAARRVNKLLILTWNPLLPEDSDRFTKVINATISSATGVLTPSDVKDDDATSLAISGRWFGRLASGERADHGFTVRVPKSVQAVEPAPPTGTVRGWTIDVAQPSASIPSTLLNNFNNTEE